MAKILQVFALLCALAVIALWAALGANTGWTKNVIQIKHVDPVTEIEYAENKNGFVPGVDFLAAGLAGSAVIFAAGFFAGRLNPKPKNS